MRTGDISGDNVEIRAQPAAQSAETERLRLYVPSAGPGGGRLRVHVFATNFLDRSLYVDHLTARWAARWST